MKTRQMNF